MNVRRTSGMMVVLMACLIATVVSSGHAQVVEVLHVNIDRPWQLNDPEDGTSWEDAFRFLQDAIAEAQAILTPPTEIEEVHIWIAAAFDGNGDPIEYRPDQSEDYDVVETCARSSFIPALNVRKTSMVMARSVCPI